MKFMMEQFNAFQANQSAPKPGSSSDGPNSIAQWFDMSSPGGVYFAERKKVPALPLGPLDGHKIDPKPTGQKAGGDSDSKSAST
eukprot:706070-Karenia_brevis.AAC.1